MENTLMPDNENVLIAEDKPNVPGFEVLQHIGAGASGEVWICRNATDKTVLAVKIVSRATSSEKEWFERELKALKKYSKIRKKPDSLLDIRHSGQSADKTFLYYTMTAADGVGGVKPTSKKYKALTLAQRLQDETMLGLTESAEIAERVIDALRTLHSHKMLHRDVKPENILFIEGRAVLADIGLVTDAEKSVSMAGTPLYFEPGKKPSVRTDLYAMGKVLYRMVNGKDPRDFPNCASRCSDTDFGLFPLLNNICMRACGDDEERYSSSEQMLGEIRMALSGQKHASAYSGVGDGFQSAPANTSYERGEPLPETLPDPERTLAADGYNMRRKIGMCGSGRVWMADAPGGETRALKIVECSDVGFYTSYHDFLKRSGDLGLTNEFIVPIRDVRVDAEHGFISFTMPLDGDKSGKKAPGRNSVTVHTLADEIRMRGRISVSECVAIGVRLLCALKALHNKRLAIRDVQPEHVLRVNQTWRVLVDTDLMSQEACFGPQSIRVSNPPDAGGTMMAEAQRTVAVILYRMATGNPEESFPLNIETEKDPGLARLRRVYEIAGSKKPSERYASVQAMESALDRVLDRESGKSPGLRGRLMSLRSRAAIVKSPDTPAKAQFKSAILDFVLSRHPLSPAPLGGYGNMTRETFSDTLNTVCMEFERRIGFEPDRLRAACTQALLRLDTTKSGTRSNLDKFLTALFLVAGTCLMGWAVYKAFFALWPEGIMSMIKRFFFVMIVLPVSLLGGWCLLRCCFALPEQKQSDNADSAPLGDNAMKALLKGIDSVTDSLWGEYGGRLMF